MTTLPKSNAMVVIVSPPCALITMVDIDHTLNSN